MNTRVIKALMVSVIALFFTLVAYTNIIAYGTNWQFVQHVLSMDTTFQNPAIMGRAITNENLQQFCYALIIGWQIITAVICWWGSLALLYHRKHSDKAYRRGKTIAATGLFFGFLLYALGFIVIGGEWFSMWQSVKWNGQSSAGLFTIIIMLVLIYLSLANDNVEENIE